jgi:hypothetical protein
MPEPLTAFERLHYAWLRLLAKLAIVVRLRDLTRWIVRRFP